MSRGVGGIGILASFQGGWLGRSRQDGKVYAFYSAELIRAKHGLVCTQQRHACGELLSFVEEDVYRKERFVGGVHRKERWEVSVERDDVWLAWWGGIC